MCLQPLNNQFICPICGSDDASLLPIGSPYPVLKHLEVIGAGTRNQKCSICGSSDRDRLVFLYLKDYYSLFDDEKINVKILHVAPEDSLAKLIISRPKLYYLPIDSFEHGYNYPRYVKEMNLLNLELEDNSFDLVICNHVLQDIKDDRKAMNEIYRVLKLGGIAILQVPISYKITSVLEHEGDKNEEFCIERYGQRFHKRIYSYEGYVNRLTSVGFHVEVIHLGKEYHRYSINHREPIFIARKLI